MKNGLFDFSQIKILVCCHKKSNLPNSQIFLPIHVGAAISNEDLSIQRDDQLNGEACDNISSKNKSYCELTAMYWAWKNIKKLYPNIKYIGLNHYRRYFNFNKNYYDHYTFPENSASKYVLNTNKLIRYLKKDVSIVAKGKIYPYSLYIDYCVCHLSEDIKILEKIIIDLYPEYLNSFVRIVRENNILSHYNMFVMSYDKFNSYCEWLFKILAEAERRINIENYSVYQTRIFGYMAERLFNVWLYHNKINIKYIPINWYVDNKKILNVVNYFRRNFKFKLSFVLNLGIKKYISHLLKY